MQQSFVKNILKTSAYVWIRKLKLFAKGNWHHNQLVCCLSDKIPVSIIYVKIMLKTFISAQNCQRVMAF